jgi:hypothetical protein
LFKKPCFEGVVSRDGALRRFYDTSIQSFAVFLYHVSQVNGGQIPIVLALKSRFSRPPWGLIFLVFRSKNGPQAVRL